MSTGLGRWVAARDQASTRVMAQLSGEDGLAGQIIEQTAGAWVKIGGRWILSFASTNYLGLATAPEVCQAAARAGRLGISLAAPRALAVDSFTPAVEQAIARLAGQEAALVFPSTTHIALDVLPLLAGPGGLLLLDERAYPLSRDGAALAARRGAQVRYFRHNDPLALARLLVAHAAGGQAIVVCDGVYPADGAPACLRQIMALAERFDALVYLDDAHGIGVLGSGPERRAPYGHHGGGTPAYLGVPSGRLVHAGSLSKSLGVPVAFVAGPAAFVAYLRAAAPSFVHTSPPALPVLAAAQTALRVHARDGELLRQRLAGRVTEFRTGLAAAGQPAAGHHLFPVQTLYYDSPEGALAAGRALRGAGVWPVLQLNPAEYRQGGALRFVLTARHTGDDVRRVVCAVAGLAGDASPARGGKRISLGRIPGSARIGRRAICCDEQNAGRPGFGADHDTRSVDELDADLVVALANTFDRAAEHSVLRGGMPARLDFHE